MKTTDHEYCDTIENGYLDAVKQLKPDDLFIIQWYVFLSFLKPTIFRYCYIGLLFKDEEWVEIVKVADESLSRLAGYVKENIFIIHTFPWAYLNKGELNAALDNGTPIDWQSGSELPYDMPKAQEKLDQIVGKCSKCEQLDYIPRFTINGTFLPYDAQYIVPYVNQGLHFTQPGLEKIRPIYREICNRIGQ